MIGWDDTTSLEALAAELDAVTHAERDLHRHAKALSKSRRAAVTRLAVAMDRALAADVGRETCGFDLGFVSEDSDEPFGPDCTKPIGHVDEHRKGDRGVLHSHSWDDSWLKHMRGESEEARRTHVHGHGRRCFRRKDGTWVIKAPGSHGEMRLIVGETCHMQHPEVTS